MLLDLPCARSAPPLLLSPAETRVLLAQYVVAEASGIRLSAFCASTRGSREEAYARQIAMYLCHVVLELSPKEIAGHFGRDRTTAVHAIQRIEDARDNPVFDHAVTSLETALLALTRKAECEEVWP